MFCPNCGAGIPKEAPVEKIAGEKGRRKKKYVMIGGGIGAILLILLVIFVPVGLFIDKKIDAQYEDKKKL